MAKGGGRIPVGKTPKATGKLVGSGKGIPARKQEGGRSKRNDNSGHAPTIGRGSGPNVAVPGLSGSSTGK